MSPFAGFNLIKFRPYISDRCRSQRKQQRTPVSCIVLPEVTLIGRHSATWLHHGCNAVLCFKGEICNVVQRDELGEGCRRYGFRKEQSCVG